MHVSEFSQYEEGSLCEIIHIDNVLILFKLQIKYISHGIVFINLKKKKGNQIFSELYQCVM